jgi:hypothetical protein
MKKQKPEPISKEFSEAIENFREKAKRSFGEGSTLVGVDGFREMKIIDHPNVPGLWAILDFDLEGQSRYAWIGNDDDLLPLGKGILFLDMQRLEAEKVAEFIKSLWTQRQKGGRHEKTLTEEENRQLELAEEFHRRKDERYLLAEAPLTPEEFYEYLHEDDPEVTMDYVRKALELYNRERDRMRKKRAEKSPP